MNLNFSDSENFPAPESAFQQKVQDFLMDFLSEGKTVEVQTSGSTGTPKIFEIEKSRMLNSAKATCRFLELKKADSALLCLPIEYISGKMMVVRAFQAKLNLYIEEPSLAPLKNLTHEIDFCAMTPLQVEHSLDKLHLVKKLIIGGAAVSESLKKKIRQQLSAINHQPSTTNHQPSTINDQPSTKIYETYGMSETLSHIALKEIYPKAQDYFQLFNGIEIGHDDRGCLTIKAPELSSEILQTNDVVELKNAKEFRFLGRADHIINSGGAKIFPEQLEAKVKREIPNEAVFLGIPHEEFGQQLVLAIEAEYSAELCDKLSQIQYEKSWQKPKDVVFIPEFPRTPNGKIHRSSLRQIICKKE